MFEIRKEFSFCAAHQLDYLPEGHKCARLHGHNYRVILVLRSDVLGPDGFVRDYGDLHKVKAYIDGFIDHRNLNDLMQNATTAENIAKSFFDLFKESYPELYEVRVSETPKTWARYHP